MVKNKILVTGATGFIGRAVCRLLAEKKIPFISHKELGLDVTLSESFEFVGCEEISTVIHLAGKTFVPDSWKSPGDFIKVNVMGTQNVAEFCRINKAKLIYVSAYVYGNSNKNPISEDQPANVNNPYALSKRLGEEVALFYQSVFNVPTAIVRPFNVYGPGQNEMFIVPEIIRQVKSGSEIRVRDLAPKRDFIYVDDVAGIIYRILEKESQGIFNAATGKSYSISELIQCIQKVAGTNLPVYSENSVREFEISDTIGDIQKAKKELEWLPEFDLESGIQKCFISNQ